MNTINMLHPAMIFIIGAFLIPILKGRLRKIFLVLSPILAFITLLCMPHGTYLAYKFLGYELVFGRVDTLSLCFAYVFVIMSFLGILYALHLKDVHAFGSSCLLAGIVLHIGDTYSLTFELLGLNSLGSLLILIGFLLNAAVPPLHAWLSDAYPKATIVGAVFLSAFTTKTAVYALLRAFSGTDILIWLGAIMALYGVVFAVLENDIRGILAYHIISYGGFLLII